MNSSSREPSLSEQRQAEIEALIRNHVHPVLDDYSECGVDMSLGGVTEAAAAITEATSPKGVITSDMIKGWRRDPAVVAAVNPHGRSHPTIDLPTKLAEWACDFEDAAKDAPTHLQATVLNTRAAECRDALRNIYGRPLSSAEPVAVKVPGTTPSIPKGQDQ